MNCTPFSLSGSESKRLGYDPDGFGKVESKLKQSGANYNSNDHYELTKEVSLNFVLFKKKLES